MLELLDTGRMAYKFGKWRGVFTLLAAVILYLFSYGLFNLGNLLPYAPGPHPFRWGVLALVVLGGIIQLIGSWQLYRDHVHGDYHFDKDHYQSHGW